MASTVLIEYTDSLLQMNASICKCNVKHKQARLYVPADQEDTRIWNNVSMHADSVQAALWGILYIMLSKIYLHATLVASQRSFRLQVSARWPQTWRRKLLPWLSFRPAQIPWQNQPPAGSMAWQSLQIGLQATSQHWQLEPSSCSMQPAENAEQVMISTGSAHAQKCCGNGCIPYGSCNGLVC